MKRGWANDCIHPRRAVEPSYAAQLAKELRDLRRAVSALERGASLRNAASSGGDGLKVDGRDGALRFSLDTRDGAVVPYDSIEKAVASYGPLVSRVIGLCAFHLA